MSFVHDDEDKAARFEQQRMERIKQLKKKKDDEERKNRQVRNELKKEQIEKAKKAYANSPLTVNQLKIYENALKRVQKSYASSPPGNKNKSKDKIVKRNCPVEEEKVCDTDKDDQMNGSFEEHVTADEENDERGFDHQEAEEEMRPVEPDEAQDHVEGEPLEG